SVFFFFFQAEDGIRDGHVTGVQTCALPICIAAHGTYDDLSDHSEAFRRLAGLSPAGSPRPVALVPGSGTRVMFYSHNGVGVGHLQRQLDLATAYRDRHPDSVVLLASGSHAASIFTIPS